jgi:predicted RND superfamily exporter protein
MAPAQHERIKGRLELWMLVVSIIAVVSAPAAAFLTFKVTVESELKQSMLSVDDHEQRIRQLESERTELVRVLSRLDQTTIDLVKKVDRIEAKIDGR